MNPVLALFSLGGGEIVLLLVFAMLLVTTLCVGLVAAVVIAFLRTRERPQPAATPTGSSTPWAGPAAGRCPQCGAGLPAGAPEGLCPACLLRRGFASEGGGPPFAPPPTAELQRLFPQLEILEPIGQGGMGAVYKARQPALDRPVALKILSPRSGGDVDFTSRFTREARALARLSHPNIVAVYDFGKVELPAGPQAPGSVIHYFIMEYVDGLNLRQMEQAQKLSPRQALEIVPQICAALQFAHDEGIVHRDIKPENVLIDKKGRVKIADFGLAKIQRPEAADLRLTGARDVVGTPHYMAPEQIEKPREVDHRADIYSLGVVFYEMLTGELPLGKFQPPSQKVQLDVRLDEVVLRTLEKEPERRYQQAGEVRTRVETIATTPDPESASAVAPQPSVVPPSSNAPADPARATGGSKRALKWLGWIGLLAAALFLVLAFVIAPYRAKTHSVSAKIPPGGPATNSSTAENSQAAVAAAQGWLALIDAGKYSESWSQAAHVFKGAVPEESWSAQLNAFRRPLGALVTRQLTLAQQASQLPGAPDGHYVIMQFDSSFADKKSAVETVTFVLEADGQWKSAGYFIK